MTRSELTGRRVVVVNWRDIDHPLAGGSEIYAAQFARALAEAGARVTFLTARPPGRTAYETRDGVVVRRGGGRFGFYLFALGWLLRHRSRIDAVIDAACGLPSFSPLVLRRRAPVLLIVHHVHQDQFGTHFPPPLAAFGRWLERFAMRRVYRRCRTVAVSESTRREMRRRLLWTQEIDILHNGADQPPVDAGGARVKDPDRIVVLGRLVVHKRVDLVLDAFRDLRGRSALSGRELRMDVIGTGPERARLEELALRSGIARAVTFHGYVREEEKAALLDRACLHVCASDAEGWGQAVIDAAAHGVPTVARDVPGLRDSVRPGQTGWLVPEPARGRPSEDVVRRGLADLMERALLEAASEGERVRRAEACAAWAGRFDWSRMRREAGELTVQILSDGAPAPSEPNRRAQVRPIERCSP